MKEKELEIARSNVSPLMEGKFGFRGKELLMKTLLFDTSRVNEKLIMEKIIQNLPGGKDELYIVHESGTNSFSLGRKDGQ